MRAGGNAVTIYDIAREANVSASTVSRVINGKAGVNEQTRNRVLELLQKHHYTPNESARGLVNRASKLVGILIADIRNLHHMEGAYYIQSELEKQGYCGIVMNTGTGPEGLSRALSNLERRQVDGAVLMGSIFQNEVTAEAIANHLDQIPVIMINGYLDLPNCYCVLSEERDGVRECVNVLVSMGRKRIAYITNTPTPSNDLKQEGFQEGIESYKKDGVAGWVYKDEQPDGLDGGRAAMKRILEEHPDVDAVIGAIDLLAVGAMQLMLEQGIAVPEKVSLIGVDNSVYGRICYPQLTSLDNQIFDSCVFGAHQLLDLLNGGHPAKCVRMRADLIKRGTT